MGNSLSGDFIGFSLGDTHSTSLGIVRVSDGSRYNENLLPTLADKTTQVGGADETYYFGTDYTQKSITISIAFDGMTEAQFRQLRTLCASKKLQKLVYDEAPYKYYMVKSTGNPTIKYVSFDEYDAEGNIAGRVYKGEGSLTFTAYYPYARCDKKALNYYSDCFIKVKAFEEGQQYFIQSIDEEGRIFYKPESDLSQEQNYYSFINSQWADASGILTLLKQEEGQIDVIPTEKDDNLQYVINTYNPGDLEADYKLYFPYDEENKIFGLLNVSVNGTILGFGSTFARLDEKDAHICVDSHANLVYGVDANFNQTGTLYNKFLTSGEFVKIPLGESTIESNIAPSKLDYEYIYY